MQAPQGLGISFLPSPEPPSSPLSPVEDQPSRQESQQQRRRESNPSHSTKQPFAQFQYQSTPYRDDLAGARGLDPQNRRRRISHSIHRVSSPNSFGTEQGIRVNDSRDDKTQNQLHTLSPLSDFDTGSSSDDYTFSPASLSSLPSSTNSEAAYYPQYHQAQRVQLQSRPYHTDVPSNIQEIFPRIPLPQPPRIETSSPQRSSNQHNDGGSSPEMLSPNSRLPAFIRDRTIQRDALSRPKSMLELGSLAAETFGSPSRVVNHSAFDDAEEEGDETTEGGDWSDLLGRNESIASSAGGHARQQLQLRKQLAKPMISHSRSRSAGNQPMQADESDLPYRQDNTLSRSGALSVRDKHGSQPFEGGEARGRAGMEEDLQRTVREKRASTIPSIVDEEESTTARLNRHATLLTIGASPLRRGKELDRILAPTSARKVLSTLHPPSPASSSATSYPQGHSRNSSLASMQQIPISFVGPVILEQAKNSNKARVEVDLSLSSSVLVEGGAMKGRIELRIRKARDNEMDVWIGRPKIRVVGFEGQSLPHSYSPRLVTD